MALLDDMRAEIDSTRTCQVGRLLAALPTDELRDELRAAIRTKVKAGGVAPAVVAAHMAKKFPDLPTISEHTVVDHRARPCGLCQ